MLLHPNVSSSLDKNFCRTGRSSLAQSRYIAPEATCHFVKLCSKTNECTAISGFLQNNKGILLPMKFTILTGMNNYFCRNHQSTHFTTNEWMSKKNVAHKPNKIFSHNNTAICNNVDGSWGCYTLWNKPDKEWQISQDLLYMWNLKEKKNY